MTRWRLQDLRRLGQRCGLEVAELGANRLLGIEARHFWNLHNQIGAALGQRTLPGGQVLPRILAAAYRALGLRHVVSGMGTSVYALYRRP